MLVASQSTRRSTDSSTAFSTTRVALTISGSVRLAAAGQQHIGRFAKQID
jgi:hypothetical protein